MKRHATILAILAIAACQTTNPQHQAKKSALTQGMAKKYIYSGKTTQTEVLEIFGPPDLVSRKAGKEVWTYDKISQKVTSSGGFLTILIAGYSRSSYESRNRSTMLMIYFDTHEVVEDYKLSVSNF